MMNKIMTITTPKSRHRRLPAPAVYETQPSLRVLPPKIQTISVLSRSDRVQFIAIVSAWAVASILFWRWWFQADHIVGVVPYLITTVAIMYDLVSMPLVFIFMIWKMKRPVPRLAPAGLRAAMVTAIVPASESIDVLERTLAAMSAVRYPHDNWVLDEGGDPHVRALCERYGARYWSRKGIPEFNQPDWPHQAKTKSGNYNSWFSDVAYARYDYIIQLDTDHAPVEDYLDKVLGYFDDPEVAYVALPSVYWNLDDWPSRGSSEQSQIFQGPIQMGYYGWADVPMIIGSHAAYRMEHLKAIGGFAPSRAEDHLDTLRFAQHGYRGVFVPENLATGLGPHTLSDYMVQEHQWAFSIAQVLMLHGRKKGLLTLRQQAIFLFSELWYAIFAFTYLLLYALPLYALITNEPLVSIAFTEFLKYSTPVVGIALLVVVWGYRKGWYRPGTHFFLSWQGVILTLARWPVVLIALFNAVVSVLFRHGAFNYMVTPKGLRGLKGRDSLRVAIPYIILAIIPIVVVLTYPMFTNSVSPRSSGYVLFALLSAISFSLLVLATAVDHVKANVKIQISLWRSVKGIAPLIIILAILVPGVVLGGVVNESSARAALLFRPNDTGTVGVTGTSSPSMSAHESSIAPPGDAGNTNQADVLGVVNAAPVVPASGAMTDDPTHAPTVEPPPAVADLAITSWIADPVREGVTFGAFDPAGQLADVSGLEHLFAAWAQDDTGGVPLEQIEASYRRGVPILLSYEPWPLEGYSQWSILSDTAKGEYDNVIRAAAQSVDALEQPILIRFGHEMDIDRLYPWSGRNSEKYVAAYQRVVDIFREEGATNVLWVWSPGGTLDAEQYYPGDAYVDYVGVTILEYTEWELDAGYLEPRPIKDLINEKYHLFLNLDKPMIIAELGIDLEEELKTDAMSNVVDSLPYFPKIRAVVYFNDRNPPTPVMVERPDWALSEEQRTLLIESLAASTWVEPSQLAE